MIRDARPEDAPAIAAIYAWYVQETAISFELLPPSAETMQQRIESITQRYPWILYEDEGRILGYAYAGEYKSREAYRYTAELAVYLDRAVRGKGLGTLLTTALLDRLRGMNYFTALACITCGNDRSIGMVEKLGFERVGITKNVGRKFGQWLSIVDYTLPLKPYADTLPEEI